MKITYFEILVADVLDAEIWRVCNRLREVSAELMTEDAFNPKRCRGKRHVRRRRIGRRTVEIELAKVNPTVS